ncbi:MAG: hypothetical protein ACLUB5_02315 [Bifidobacterium dentium]
MRCEYPVTVSAIAGRALSIEKADVKKVVFSAIALHCETISSVKPVSKVAESRFLEYLFSREIGFHKEKRLPIVWKYDFGKRFLQYVMRFTFR